MWKVCAGQIKILKKEPALSLSLAPNNRVLGFVSCCPDLCTILNDVNICCGKTALRGRVEEQSVICASVGSVLPRTDMIQFQSLLMETVWCFFL